MALCGQQLAGCFGVCVYLLGYEGKIDLKLILDKIFYKL